MRPPLHEPSFRASTAQLGMTLFLVSLGVLFAASLVAFVITRLQAPGWRAPGTPGLPWGVAGSTLLVAAGSGALQGALRALRENRLEAAERRLGWAFFLALAFLAAQALNWRALHGATGPMLGSSLYVFSFFLLTGVHAAHVLGGLAALVVVWNAAHRRQYSSSRHQGVRFVAQYWHFLAVVWVILLAALLLGG